MDLSQLGSQNSPQLNGKLEMDKEIEDSSQLNNLNVPPTPVPVPM